MIGILVKRIQFGINVYSGISPSLLATMSLSVNIKGKNHLELIQNMAKAGLIQNQQEIQAFKQVDRQLFTTVKNPYENRPYPISNKENMTDIFTHSVIVNNLSPYWKNNLTILDIGTGHGYLPLLISKILLNKGFKQYSITGLDISKQSISYCQRLLKETRQQEKGITFQCKDLNKYLQTIRNESIDIVIGGYFFQEDLTEKVIKKLSRSGVGIWPTRSDAGQALYKIQKNKQKVYLIQTLFSMPVVNSQVSKYFMEEGQYSEETKETENNLPEMDVEQVKIIKKEMEELLRKELKQLIEKYRKIDGKVLTLKEMKQNPQINKKMIELEKLPKLKVKCQIK